MTIASALPFAIVLLFALVGLMKALRIESFKRDSLSYSPAPTITSNSESWKERLQNMVDFPNKQRVKKYIDEVGLGAFNAVRLELAATGIEAKIEQTDKGIYFSVEQDEQQHFVYALRPVPHAQPDYAQDNDDESSDDNLYYRAEVHLSEGGQDYCVMGWSKLAVINDVVDQYQKHLHFLHLMR
jgi:choline/glycine/proline betaine transport protein